MPATKTARCDGCGSKGAMVAQCKTKWFCKDCLTEARAYAVVRMQRSFRCASDALRALAAANSCE